MLNDVFGSVTAVDDILSALMGKLASGIDDAAKVEVNEMISKL